jgi:hypothetical protein
MQVKDPTEQLDEREEEILDFNKPSFKFEPNEHHEWRQQGPYLVCKSCDLEHAQWVGMNKELIGINDKGQPILKNR